jgi:hypothetical protein
MYRSLTIKSIYYTYKYTQKEWDWWHFWEFLHFIIVPQIPLIFILFFILFIRIILYKLILSFIEDDHNKRYKKNGKFMFDILNIIMIEYFYTLY